MGTMTSVGFFSRSTVKRAMHMLVPTLVVAASLAGPIAPANAAPSMIIVSNGTPLTVTTLGAGASISINACFDGAVARTGGSDGDVTLVLNSRGAGIAWAGARSTSVGLPAGTNNCLTFVYAVASNDTSQAQLKATSLTLANSAQLTVTGRDTITTNTTFAGDGQTITGGPLNAALSVDVTAPTTSSLLPVDGASAVAAAGNLVLTTSERVTPALGVSTRSCNAGVATISTASTPPVNVGDLIVTSQVGPGYDSGTGGMTFFRVTAVSGLNVSYAVACTNESSMPAGGLMIPLRFITVAEDADTTKNVTNLAIASNVATLTSNAHGFEVGDTVVIENMATAGGAQRQIDGAFVVLSADANTFTVNLTRASGASLSNVANTPNVVSVAASAGTARRVVEAIPSYGSSLTYSSGNSAPFTLTIDPTGSLPGNTALHVRVQAGAVLDRFGNALAAISNATTWNFETGAAPASIVNITSSTANGPYRSGGGTAPSIQVKFNQAVSVTGTPQLVLNSGNDAVASYASGSGTKTLTFTYTIGAAHSTLAQAGKRLNVTGLQLNGGTISGVTGSIVVPSSGATGSLNLNKNITIDNVAPQPMGFMPFPGAVGAQPTQALTMMFPENVSVVDTKKLFIKTVVPHVAKNISSAALASNVATITTGTAHGLVAGNTVTIAGMTGANAGVFNGTYLVASAPSTTTFTFARTNADVASAVADGTVIRVAWETITLNGGGGGNAAVDNFPNNSGAAITVTRLGKASTVNLVMDPPTNYYVEAESGAVLDLAGNASAALTGSAVWTFQASPDSVAPVFNPNQSDPPHNMGSFDPTRSLQLSFSEAVSTVATKTIRLCTGAANCATPVETFTLPSDSVSSLGGGLRIQVDPTANLTASTTYFLLIDAGAFQDGAGNVTAAATTAGQYQFTTMGMGGGGGGGVSCGPPPLPPCNVGPGLNFGPGGMIQNPGAIGGSDMANLRPDNFMGFRPDDARNLGAGALQNFRPDQFGALPPTAMAGFDRNQIGNLNPAAMAGMNQDQLRALPPEAMQGFRPDQFAQLPPSAMAAMDQTRLGALPPSAMAGFNANQMAQLPPSAMAAFDPTRMQQLPPSAMAGFNANQMQQLPPAAMQGFNANQMAQLPPSAMQGFNPTKMAQLPPSAMGGFNANQMAQLPPAAFTAFDPTKVQNLPPAAMAGFDATRMGQMPPTAMQGFKPDQFAQLPPQAMAGVSPTMMAQFPPSAMGGFNANQMAALPPEAMKVFDPSKMQNLPPAAMAGFDPTKMQAMPPTAMAVMNPNQLGQMPPTAFAAIQPQQFNVLPPTAMQGFNPQLMAALPPQMVQNFKPDQFAQIPPTAMGGFNEDRFRALPAQAMTAFNPQQMNAVPPAAMEGMRFSQMNVIPPTAMQGFKPDQFAALPPQAMQGFKPDQFAALPPQALSGMEPQQMRALPPDAARSLSPQQVTAFPPQTMAAIPPGVFRAFPPEAIAALTPEQRNALPPQALNPPPLAQPATAGNIGAIINSISGWNIDKVPPAAFTGMKPADLSKLPSDAFNALSPLQVGALPATAMGGMKPAQLSSLPPEAMAAFKPTQLGALPPAAMAAMSPAQFGSLPPAAMAAMKPTQAGQLPPEAFEAMKPTQMNQLPPQAFGAMKPTQIGSLPPEAMAAMKPTQLGALPPNALTALDSQQLAALPATAMAVMKPTQAAALPPAAMAEMKPAQVGALPPSAVGSFKPDQMAALPPEALTTMKPTQVGALKPTAVAALEPEQMAALPATALTQMKPTQAAALPIDAIAEMKPAQVGALPPAAVGGLKPDQVSALPPEAMTSMKPTQVAALKPAALGGLEPAQVDALPPTALRQVSGAQLGAIPTDALKSLDTAQINALPSEAFRGMKPDQANALSPDQARAMAPADVAQMPPAVRTIVNGLKAQPPA